MHASSSYVRLPDQDELKARYIGAPIDSLPTPSVLVDRHKVLYNIRQMQKTIDNWHCLLRVHIKTHKTKEGVALQLSGSQQHAIAVSTMAEAWGVVSSRLIEEGIVDDILYGVPVGIHKIDEIIELRQAIRSKSASADIKLLVDNIVQVEALQAKLSNNPISVFLKIDGGYNRAGLGVDSPLLPALVAKISHCDQITLHGVYTHAGNSYKSSNSAMSSSYLKGELQCVNEAAQIVSNILEKQEDRHRHRLPFVLSVGSTPTAHAASNASDLAHLRGELHGELEIHPGNYAFLDLQQVSTGAIPSEDGVAAIDRCAMTVLAAVTSVYPGRGLQGTALLQTSSQAAPEDEAMCDAGGIALSKDTGQYAGYGHVIWPEQYVGWEVGRIAQEHGVLTMRQGGPSQWAKEWGRSVSDAATSLVKVAECVQIVPQHACMVAAAHPWFFVYDSSQSGAATPTVVDIWVPWKGW